MNRKPRILVIGGLAAGPSAASKAKRTNPDAEIILFEKTKYISYGICEIPYYLTGEFKDKHDLVVYSPERLQREKNVTVHTQSAIESIDRKNRTIQVHDRERDVRRKEQYDKLIVATGSVPRLLPFMDRRISNVFTVKELGDAYELDSFLKRKKPGKAVVVGGGYIGLEMTESLQRLNVDVTLIHRHAYPLSGMEKENGEELVSALREHGVYFVPEGNVVSFGTDTDGNVKTVVTDDGAYDAEVVIVAIGVSPNVSLARDAGISIGRLGGIKTDKKQLTNDEKIFSAGDCCEVKNLLSNRSSYIPLATVASKMAWTAGENAAGGSSVFSGAIRNIAVRVFGYEVARVGLTTKEADAAGFKTETGTIEAPSRVAGMPGAARLRVTYIAEKDTGKLLGATLQGKDGAAHRGNILAAMMQMGATVREISDLDLMYAPPFSPLWDPVLIAANQMLKKL